jgi:hypothetical protein
MSARPILHLHKRPDPRVTAWIQRLNGRDPSSPEAKAVYEEAFSAGLVGELCDGLQLSAAADLREARALEAEKRKRWGPK